MTETTQKIRCPTRGEFLKASFEFLNPCLKLAQAAGTGRVRQTVCSSIPEKALHRCKFGRVLTPDLRGCVSRRFVRAAGPLPVAVVLTPCVAPIVVPRHLECGRGTTLCYQTRLELCSKSTSELVCWPRLPAARLAPECPDPLGERITGSELGYKLTGEQR